MKVKNIKKIIGNKIVGGSLPDIDTDFSTLGKPKVREYMEKRFGKNQVASVGTISTLKLKGALRDLDRQFDNNVSLANLVTSTIDVKDSTMLDLYKRSAKEMKLKEYIKSNSDIFHMMPSILNQPKTKSIHPCAIIIMPSQLKSMEWMPLRKQNGFFVTEWDGNEADGAGFLKVDVLGLSQLDKFNDILKLIEGNGKDVPDIYNLPIDNNVYRYFSNGWNGDVFQMGGDSISLFTKYLKPQNIEDLIAVNALYRPGPMENNYHNIFAKCKNEGRKPEYLWGTEDITKDTFGLLVYQEQVMEVCQKLGGLTQMEADDVRRAMGKKDVEYLNMWRDRLEKGFLSNGSSKEEFIKTWEVMLEFAKYSFNRSHSAAYAITAYICQWLKVNYPLEFWTIAIKYANEDEKLKYLSEIFAAKSIKVVSPHINMSMNNTTSDEKKNTIYWGIESIKGIGETTAEQIIEIRRSGGLYKNLIDFIDRNTFVGSKVKKTTYEALIACGAFDELENIGDIKSNRFNLINKYREYKKVKVSNPTRDIYTIGKYQYNWWWKLQEKKLTGLVHMDYENLCLENNLSNPCTQEQLINQQLKGINVSYGGYVIDCIVRSSVKGKFAIVTIESNYKIYKVILWSDEYLSYKEEVDFCKKNFILFNATLRYEDKYAKDNQFILGKESKFIVLK